MQSFLVLNHPCSISRMFKLDTLEPDCEDYGQAVIYHGTVADHPYYFQLDSHHKIMTGKVLPPTRFDVS